MTRSRWPFALVAAALAAGGIPGCLDTAGPCICTTEFRSVMLTVIDDTGNPVANVSLTRTNLRSGAELKPTAGPPVPGTYVVADDGMRDAFSSEGDAVRVTGQQGGATFTTYCVVAVPAPCRCHVVKLLGPDTVIIGEQPPP